MQKSHIRQESLLDTNVALEYGILRRNVETEKLLACYMTRPLIDSLYLIFSLGCRNRLQFNYEQKLSSSVCSRMLVMTVR